jgi:putative acyl-CoA dehydrogenase
MEVLGGNGYVEDAPLARFYRQAPLNSIWEGSGNVMCLDVLRAFGKVPAVLDALVAELRAAGGANSTYDAFSAALIDDLRRSAFEEADARALTERIALATQGALLITSGVTAVSDAFCATRLADGRWGRTFGILPAGIATAPMLARALPA